jgi:multiple sugar transport system substrate-binding protein
VAKNPAVGSVLSEMKQIRPNLGEIAQGYLGGNVDDVGAELTRYRSRLATERDRAIEVVSSRGQEVSLDDWIFDDQSIGESADQTTGSPRP